MAEKTLVEIRWADGTETKSLTPGEIARLEAMAVPYTILPIHPRTFQRE